MKRKRWIGCQIRTFLSWLLLLGTVILGLLLGLNLLNPPSAMAAIRQLEEAPGQMVYQSWQTLKDQHRNSWQAVVFKRSYPDGATSFELRLVGFPGVAEIDRSQPLALTNSLGKTLMAADTSSSIFMESDRPEPNVGQYDLQPLLPQLQAEIPLTLTMSTRQHEAIRLFVPSLLVQEWKTVAERE